MANRTDGGIFDDSNIWAETGDKTNPPFTESEGWGITYSQAGGNPVERTLLNRNFNKISAALYDANRFGANLAWSNLVQYEIGATVIGSDNVKYTSKTVNTNIDPVSDNGTNWKKDIPVITGDGSNINVSTDARNNVSVALTSNLSDKANKILDNVTVGDLLGKFENSNSIIWSSSGGKAKADYRYRDMLQFINVNVTLTAAEIGRNIYFATDSSGTGDYSITLPSAASVPNNWFVDISVVNVKNTVGGLLKIVPSGSDLIIRNNVQANSSVNFIVGTKNTFLRVSKLPNINVYMVAGMNEASYEEEDTTLITGGQLLSRGYSLIGDTLTQWVHLVSNVNTFPAGSRANMVEVFLPLPYLNYRYCSTVSVDDDPNKVDSASYGNQPAAYAYSASAQTVRIGSYYNQSGIRLWLSTVGISTGFRG